MIIATKPIIQKPVPGAYGIPTDFDFGKYDSQEKTFLEYRSRAIKFFKFTIWFCLTFVISISATMRMRANYAAFFGIAGAVGPFCVLLSMPIWHFIDFEALIKPSKDGCLACWDKISAYKADLATWSFTNSERGLGYWQSLRGIDFEHAAASMFRRRGCEVTVTKGSGDGGIDLVLNIAGKAYWCQCKGHAKPVQPAPIREIAGVCRRGQAVPVLLAVNGYTKSAREEAGGLGVVCLDAPDLCRLAGLERITSPLESEAGRRITALHPPRPSRQAAL